MSISKIKALLNAAVSPKAALVAIAGLDPRLRSFMSAAAAAGYGADAVLNHLRDASLSPEQRAKKEDVMGRAAKGVARPEEQVEAQGIERGQRATGTMASLAGLGAGGVASQLTSNQPQVSAESPQTSAQTVDSPAQSQGNFIQRALEGVEFFDLPDEIRAGIAPHVKQLDRLEQDGQQWGSTPVQRLVKAIRSRVGLADREEARFTARRGEQAMQQEQQQAAPQASQADAQLSQMLDRLAGILGG